ncbi:hypothetical protein [Actinoplanes xinjiangensis]|uniref:Uncharacterized protein n=1 Tax=Actinoplanes xinjiangensis TaxID=512350 RepID=A0A316FTJ6_9ACTN|nr:hypothetical protein [Actinoplanes xinjiangensis]PWK52044.1 hypothetical protein BC793_10153 [Actinoplanes xinjiangensis]
MRKFDAAVAGRSIAVGTASGAVFGFVVMALLFAGGVYKAMTDPEWHAGPGGGGGLVLGTLIGAIIGLLTGLLAGLLLLLPAPWLRERRLRGRLGCAAACGAAVGTPFLVAGIGWGLWADEPVAWIAAGLMAYAAAIGAWKSPFILAFERRAGT